MNKTQILSAASSMVPFMKPALLVLVLILAALLLSSVVFTITAARSKQKLSTGKLVLFAMLYTATAVVVACTLLCFSRYGAIDKSTPIATTTETTTWTEESTTVATTQPTEATTVPPTEPEPTYDAANTDNSDPKKWAIKWDIIENGSVVSNYQHPDSISFGDADAYTALEGIVSFRGDNYRTGATYGTATVTNKTLSQKWSANIASLNKWTGCGWTGQPLVVRWDSKTKSIMNLYADKKAKEDLVEVIYATLDGNIYFYDLEDGSYTRDPLWIGMNFKGAGSLDPRGYPLMYVGSGDSNNGKPPRMYVISLVEGKILYEQSGSDSDAKRSWYAFDSAPLVDAETDTLIWPGESGVLYTIKLNSAFDPDAGTLSVAPETMVKTRYTTNTGRKVGCESSAIIVDRYLYFADNGGMFFCVDLDTMGLVWAQDTGDDVNATPVFQWESDGKGYIYTGTSTEYAGDKAYIHKLDAATGEIIWEKVFRNVAFNSSVSGGVLSSPLLGKAGTDMEGLIIYSIARTPTTYGGTLVALNTQTGETVWEKELSNYTWSSPTGIYTEDGTAYFVLCDSTGKALLYHGATGELLSTVSLGSNVEASPIVFENTIVVGTRGQRVFGLSID